MTHEEFKNLKTGDIVKHVSNGRLFIVSANYGTRVTAVTTADLTNSSEWLKINSKTTNQKQIGENDD